MLERFFSFDPSPTTIAFARKYLSTEKKQKVQEMVRNIKVELLKTLESCSWMDAESRVNVLDKANAITDIIGAPRDYFDDIVFCQTSDLNYVNKLKTEIVEVIKFLSVFRLSTIQMDFSKCFYSRTDSYSIPIISNYT